MKNLTNAKTVVTLKDSVWESRLFFHQEFVPCGEQWLSYQKQQPYQHNCKRKDNMWLMSSSDDCTCVLGFFMLRRLVLWLVLVVHWSFPCFSFVSNQTQLNYYQEIPHQNHSLETETTLSSAVIVIWNWIAEMSVWGKEVGEGERMMFFCQKGTFWSELG